MAFLLEWVTSTISFIPAARASSTTYWMTGLSTTVTISLGITLLAGKNRVPRPATGRTALVTFTVTPVISQRSENRKAQREQSSEEIDFLSAQPVNHSTPIKTELGYNIHKIATGMQLWPAALSCAWTAPGTPTTRATRSPMWSSCCAPYHRWTAEAPARSSTTAVA